MYICPRQIKMLFIINMTMIIESLENPKIKNIVKLRESSRQRQELALFLIEGYREIGLALRAGVQIENLFYSPGYIKRGPAIEEEKIIEVSKKVFSKISYREKPDGFLAVAKINDKKLADLKLSANPLLVVLEAVEKPGNLGAILRTADAAGADAVIINDAKTDIYNPNVIRASQGTVFTVTVVLSSVSETVKFCRSHKIKVLAAVMNAKKEYTAVDYKQNFAI